MNRMFAFLLGLALLLGAGPVSAFMLQDDTICQDDVVLSSVSVTSEVFKCCNQDARFNAAASAVKEAHFKIQELCYEAGCEVSAIARVCVTYEQLDDESCVATATVWYRCCCCVLSDASSVDLCDLDQSVCDEHFIQNLADRARYECCDVESRWNATYETMKSVYNQAAYNCSLLDCLGDLYVRGFQIVYGPTSVDGVCVVASRIYYSCCCVCN